MPDYKIPIYEGVNDNPIPPSPINNANADYFIAKYNLLVDELFSGQENTYENIISNTVTYFIDSQNGDDNDLSRNGSNLSNSFKSIKGLLKYINRENIVYDNDLTINLRFSGIFDITFELFNLELIPFLNKKTTSIINIEARDLTSGYIFEISSSYIQLNIAAKTRIRHATLLFRGSTSTHPNIDLEISNSSLSFLTNDAQIEFGKNSNVRINNCEISTDFINTPIIFNKNASLDLRDTNNIYATEADSGYLFKFKAESSLYVEDSYFAEKSGSKEREYIFSLEQSSKLYCKNNAAITQYKISLDDNFAYFDIRFSEENELNQKILNVIGQAPNNSIPIEAIDGYEELEEITPAEVRDKLSELSGDNRLSAAYIKDINYLDYYSQTTQEFIQPEEGGLVEIKMASNNWFQPNQFLHIKEAGLYEVISLLGDGALVKNTGDFINRPEGEEIAEGKQITLSARPGWPGFTYTSSIFQQAEVGEEITIQFIDTSAFYVGSVLYIEAADYYGVVEINRENNEVICRRLGYLVTVPIGTNIDLGSRVTISGLRGRKGDYPIGFLTHDFFIPPIGQEVEIRCNDTSFMNLLSIIDIEQVGAFRVTEIIDSKKIRVKNLGYSKNLSPGLEAYSPKQIIIAGESGKNCISTVLDTSSISSNTDTFGIFVDNTDWCIIGQKAEINNNFYEVVNFNNSIGTITLKNIEETPPGTQILPGNIVIPIAKKGEKGDKGESFAVVNEDTSVEDQFILNLDNTSIFIEDTYIGIQGIPGHFLILNNDLENNALLLKNISQMPETLISSGTKIANIGFPDLNTIKYKGFEQPGINLNVEIETLQITTNFEVGTYCHISNGGFYYIVAKTSKGFILKNIWHFENKPPESFIEDGFARVVIGLPKHEVFALQSPFLQPSKNGIVETEFFNFRFLNVGDILKSPNNGYYFVENISTENAKIYLKNLGYNFSDEKAEGNEVEANSLFWKVPPRGETEFNGNYTEIISDFLIPAFNKTTQISVANTNWIIPGIFIAIKGGGNSFEVIEKHSSHILTIRNASRENNSNAMIHSHAMVTTGNASESPQRIIHNHKALFYAQISHQNIYS